MKVLVVGRGGREHAIVKSLSQDPNVTKIFAAPGNPGMTEATLVKLEETAVAELVAFAGSEDIGLVVVGPEVALMAGVVDGMNAVGIKAFGPTQAAALIEGGKAFAKRIMVKYDIPTAAYGEFDDTQVAEAIEFLQSQDMPIVIKAGGLAAGKGVVICQTLAEAEATVRDMLEDKMFGDASANVVIEEFLDGEEFSLMSFVANGKFYPMPIARDYKRAFDNDEGPNTGGMGAHSPHPLISQADYDQALREVVKPTVDGMIEEGLNFTGILYAGLIQTKKGPKVIEFNARFGDPETEVVLPLLEGNLSEIFLDLIDGNEPKISWKDEQTVGVVLASKGYPGDYPTGVVIEGLDTLEGVEVYHMGTDLKDGKVVTNGGRVLFVTANGKDLADARAKVYEEIKKIKSDGLFYRTDIAAKV